MKRDKDSDANDRRDGGRSKFGRRDDGRSGSERRGPGRPAGGSGRPTGGPSRDFGSGDRPRSPRAEGESGSRFGQNRKFDSNNDKPRFNRDSDRPRFPRSDDKRDERPRNTGADREQRGFGSRPDEDRKPRPERESGNRREVGRDRRSSTDRPRFNRSEGQPDGDRPRFNRSGDRPEGDRPRFSRPDDRSGNDRPRFNRSEDRPDGDRPRFNRSEDRPEGDRPRFNRPEGRPDGDRPRFNRPEGRPDGDRPRFNRSEDRPEGDRPRFNRPEGRPDGDKPRFNREGGSRPERTADRDGDKPRFNRESTDRPRFDREGGNRRDENDRFGRERRVDERGDRPRGEGEDRPRFNRDRDSGRGDSKPRFERDGDKGERKFERRDDRKEGDNERFSKDQSADSRERRVGRFSKAPSYNLDAMRENLPANRKKHVERDEAKKRPVNDGTIRLNRYIANAGICSRREADELIARGDISVNGKVITEMGYKVKQTDTVKFGTKVLNPEKTIYVLLNKPKDYITTTDDPEERRTVMELVADAGPFRIYPVGRLDRNTTGLLLLTNDGELADKLTHPSNNVKKIYQAELDKPLTEEHFEAIRNGIELEDGLIKPDDLGIVTPDAHVIGIEIHSGRNRIVRRIFEHFGYEVTKLDRTTYASLTKKELPRGKWRFLEPKEVVKLKYF